MNEIWTGNTDQRAAAVRARTIDMCLGTRVLMAIFSLMTVLATQAPHAADLNSPIGLWKTERGLVRIYESQGALFGRIEKSFTPADEKRLCTACKDDRKDQPVIGMVILRDVRQVGSIYEGGDILDTLTGSVYQCKVALDPSGSHLTIRGFVGVSLFGRSVVWSRVE